MFVGRGTPPVITEDDTTDAIIPVTRITNALRPWDPEVTAVIKLFIIIPPI